MKKILLLGDTGKMGVAVKNVFKKDYVLVCKNSNDFNALNFSDVESLIEKNDPDIVVNTIAFLGIDACGREPEKAFRLNTLYPRLLAELSCKKDFLLIHFSTDSVFNGEKEDFYVEPDTPCPLNVYGMTKYGGDCFIQAIAKSYYIFRVSVLFGETSKDNQITDKMLSRIMKGEKTIMVSEDVIFSPSYSKDIAKEVKRIIEAGYPFGLYHVANEGKASLHDLMKEITDTLELDVTLQRASFKNFHTSEIRNTYTPIRSEKISSLRPWEEAVKEYCIYLETKYGKTIKHC